MFRKIFNFIKKQGLIMILAALVIILGAVYFTFRPQKEPTPAIRKDLTLLEAPLLETQPISASLDINQLEKKIDLLPSEAAVYRIKPVDFDRQQALAIAKKLGFNSEPKTTGNQIEKPNYYWSEGEKILSISLAEKKVNYSLNLLEYPQIIAGPPPYQEEAIAAAEKFLDQHQFLAPPELELVATAIVYEKVVGPRYIETADSFEANLVRIEFEYRLENQKLTAANPLTTLIRFRIGPGLKILNFNYRLPVEKIEILASYPLKTKVMIIEALSQPQISYLQSPTTYQNSLEPLRADDLFSLQLENVELVYLQSEAIETYLQPILAFSGIGQFKNGQTSQVFLYLPAIDPDYFLTPEP